MTPLEKKSQSPLYQQLMTRLKNDITAGVYPAGARIPSEQLLCDTYGVSRVTVRKAMLDLVSSMMLSSSLGIGVLLSAFAVFVIQGGLVLLSGLIAPFMSASAIAEMTCAGSLLIVMIGTNLMGMTKIKVADFLPAGALAVLVISQTSSGCSAIIG